MSFKNEFIDFLIFYQILKNVNYLPFYTITLVGYVITHGTFFKMSKKCYLQTDEV